MMLHVGQKVVCINDKFPAWTATFNVALPTQGGIYTIRDISDFSKGTIILLEEIRNIPCCINDDTGQIVEPAFPHNRFRPIVERKTDISVFTEMLTDQKIGADA